MKECWTTATTFDDEAHQLQQKIDTRSREIQEMHRTMISKKTASTALKNIVKNKQKNSTAKNRASFQRRPHQPISGEVKNLIEKEIFDNGKTQVEVAKTFGINDRQVRRILEEARSGGSSSLANKRGPKSKFTPEIVVLILTLLEDNSSTTLKQLCKHIQAKFNIQVTPTAVNKILKQADVTWKTVTPIPHKWNEAAFLQQCHDYVLHRLTNVGQKLVFIDESGFNSLTQPFHGYSLSGHAAALKTNACGSMINLIGAMAKTGFIYYELLNEDSKRKTGTTSADICNFLL